MIRTINKFRYVARQHSVKQALVRIAVRANGISFITSIQFELFPRQMFLIIRTIYLSSTVGMYTCHIISANVANMNYKRIYVFNEIFLLRTIEILEIQKRVSVFSYGQVTYTSRSRRCLENMLRRNIQLRIQFIQRLILKQFRSFFEYALNFLSPVGNFLL